MKKTVKILMAAVLAVVAAFSFACADNGDSAKTQGLHYKQFKGDDFYTVIDYVDDGTTKSLDIGKIADEKKITIGAIKANAFEGNASLEEIIVPSTVTEIEGGAFNGIKNLKKITLPFVGATANADALDGQTASATDKSVDGERNFGYIFGTETFEQGSAVTQTYGAESTNTYYIPYTLTEVTVNPAKDGYQLPMYAFNGCSNLIKITLGEKVTAIGVSAFQGCSNLATVEMKNGVKNIYANAFNGCEKLGDYDAEKHTGLNFGGSTFDCIGEKAFYKTVIKTLNLTVKEIGTNAFSESSVKAVTLNGAETIGNYAFYKCESLETVNVVGATGANVKIGISAFEDCKNADVSALDSFADKGVNWNKGTK